MRLHSKGHGRDGHRPQLQPDFAVIDGRAQSEHVSVASYRDGLQRALDARPNGSAA
jgi:hypothetical protein